MKTRTPHHTPPLAALTLGLILALPAYADIASSYELTRLGLTDAGHTNSSTGYQYSSVSALNNAGQAVGVSQSYNGSTHTGNSAWLFNGTTTQNIGLTGTGYINTITGEYNSQANLLNDNGQATGFSWRFNGSAFAGQSAWLYNGTTTQNIGLTGTGYTNTSNGYQYSSVNALNNAGQAVGYSQRYNGSTDTGRSAWLYNGTTTQNIGLTGTGYTTTNGTQFSYVNALNNAGQAVGYSHRFNGSSNTGQSAWLYNGTTTQNIGLTGTGYTNTSNGTQNSWVNALNNAGQAVGYSQRYNGSTGTGQSAWLYNGTTTQNIGLTGTGYTSTSNGIQSSNVNFINKAGQAAGTSARFNGSSNTGQSAWLYNGTTTQNIGLTGTGYTNTSNGIQNSSVNALNNAGQVAGISWRYNGSTDTGRSAWLFNGTTTQNIGLTGTGYTNTSNGTQNSNVYFINNIGQAAGYSQRYNGSTGTGQSAWFYDDDQNQTYAFDFSLRSDGYGYSQISYLGDDGLALGYYELFNGASSLGNRAFAWTMEDGFAYLGSLIEGGLVTDWSYLASAYRSNAPGQIIGHGTLALGGGQGAYLLTAVPAAPIPEADTYAFMALGMGLVGFLVRRRKRQSA